MQLEERLGPAKSPQLSRLEPRRSETDLRKRSQLPQIRLVALGLAETEVGATKEEK